MQKVNEISIKVGVKTLGYPDFTIYNDRVLLRNMLIGDKFHWQRTISAELPGKIIVIDNTDSPYNEYKNRAKFEDSVSLINIVPIEDYIRCVVASEMNPEAPSEFLKAHAVISRSWALGKILAGNKNDNSGKISSGDTLITWQDTSSHLRFDVCSDDHCQRYQGIQVIPETTLMALHETEGEVLVDKAGNVADSRFSKCCGGYTEEFRTCWQSKKIPYLTAHPDKWCNLDTLSSASKKMVLKSVLKDYDLMTENYGYTWQSEISKSDIEKNLFSRFGRNVGKIERIYPLHKGTSGRIDLLRIEGSQGSLDLGKELAIRRLLSPTHLYSSAFSITDKGDSIHLEGRGWGHGVGLCQIGAANMALKGFGYREILSFYYPGTSVIKKF